MFGTTTRILIAFGMAILCAGASAQFDTGDRIAAKPAWDSFKLNPKTRVKLDFKNANVDLVIGFISRTSKVTIVKDPSLTGPITVTSAGSVPLSEAFEILKSVLSMKGYDIAKEGSHLVVRQRQGGRGSRAGGPGTDGTTATGMPPGFDISQLTQRQSELRVYPIQYASATRVASVINDVFAGVQDPMQQMLMQMGGPMAAIMAQRGGGRGNRGGGMRFGGASNAGGAVRASADDYSNSVIVNAAAKDQEQVADLIRQIDKQADAPMRSRVFKLEYAVASDLAPIVQNVLTSNAPTGKGGGSDNVPIGQRFQAAFRLGSTSAAFGNVVAESRTNSLVVTATDDNLKVIGDVIKELDKEVKFEPTTFVFPLSNARADLLAQLLTQAFGNRSGTGTGGGRSTSTTGYSPFGTNLNNARVGGGTGGGGGGGSRSLGGDIQGNDANKLDPNQIELALQNPGADGGELQTQIFAQGFGGFGGQRSTSTQQTRGVNSEGKLVNVRDLTGQVTVIADPNTNSLIVVTLPENAELIKKILEQLDKIPEQVMIETIIVEATLDASSKMGVEWKFTEKNLAGDKGNTGTFQQDYGLTTATPAPTGFKFTMTGGNLSAFLNLLKSDQKFQVLSTPRIFTANNSQAQINISQSIPYVLSQREDANGNLTFNYAFQDVGIVLTVTPRITADGYVTMDITQTANDLQGYTSFNAPIVNQRQATTSVSVKDGETIILGGIIRSTVTATTNKIPLLGDIPLLGNLFKSTSKEKQKTELLVFLTPRVVRDPAQAKKLMEEQKAKLAPDTQKSLKDVIPPSQQGGTDQGDGKPKGGS